MPDSTLLASIGDTPVVELPRLSPRPGVQLFAKLESHNPSGSIKDRIALAIVEELERSHGLQPGDLLVEASTGNTAIALAMVARQKGYRFRAVTPKRVVPSIHDVLDVMGVEVESVEPRLGMVGAIERARELADELGGYAVRQFDDPLNVETHRRSTGDEIVRDLGAVDALVSGIGTGGTLMGVGQRLREANPDVRLVGVEPRFGEKLQGLRSPDEGFLPPLLDLDELGGRFLVTASQSLVAARRVMREEGFLVGVSAGATLHAALRVASRMERGRIVVMCSDGAWKYLPSRPWDAAEAGDPRLDDVYWW